MNDQGQPGPGWTVVLRRRPARIVEGRPEGGYTDTTMKFLPRKAKADPETAVNQATWSGPPRLADRSCCCPARPVVTVFIPPAAEQPHRVDLLLCGHHYLTSRAALAAAGAVVIDETGAVLEPAPASTGTTSPAYADTTPR